MQTDKQKDLELLQKLKQGDATAVRKWYRKYFPALLALIAKRVASEKDAEELAQDTFLSCMKHLPLFRGESAIWTWMVKIAQHEVADYYRKRYAKKVIHLFPLSELLPSEDLDHAHEVSQKVRRVLSAMTAENREVLLMKYVDRKKVKHIAKEMGKTVKAIESILFRARVEFKELYFAE
jgi:RNA polymerase sigma-70 factor (ECF subfamily)